MAPRRSPNTVQCTVCGERFRTKALRRRHLGRDHRERYPGTTNYHQVAGEVPKKATGLHIFKCWARHHRPPKGFRKEDLPLAQVLYSHNGKHHYQEMVKYGPLRSDFLNEVLFYHKRRH